MNDLVARFLPRFAALARERTSRALAVAAAADTAQGGLVAREMHSVAGEAGMLGLEAVLQAAREAESIAKRFTADVGQAAALHAALGRLEAAVAEATRGTP